MTQRLDDEDRIVAASAQSADSRPKTFADLALAETVTPSDFLVTFHDYSTGGWAINAETTVGVFNRVESQLTVEQLRQVVRDSMAGARIQDRLGEPNLKQRVDRASLEARSLHGTINHLVEVVNYVRVGRLANDAIATRGNPPPVLQR